MKFEAPSGEDKTQGSFLSLRIPVVMSERLRKVAKKKKTSLSTLIRAMINHCLDETEGR